MLPPPSPSLNQKTILSSPTALNNNNTSLQQQQQSSSSSSPSQSPSPSQTQQPMFNSFPSKFVF